ncbi:MAG: glycosyltransferase [Methyloprofundus sp.]|nr:glycosyltransferase [Methyloprofundus sp.]
MYQKYKISIITPSLNGGGAERVAINLANHFVSVGNEVDLVVFKLIGPYQSLISPGVNVVDLNVSRTRYVFLKMRRYLRANRNSLVLSVIRDSNIFVGLAAIGLRLKSITYREANTLDGVLSKNLPSRFIYLSLMKLAYSRADNIIANSDDTKADLVGNGLTNKNKVSVIRNPVLVPNYEKSKSAHVDEDWFRRSDLKVVLSVGRFHPQKNFLFLISVFKEVYHENQSARLMIVGEGEEKQCLLDQIKKEGLTEVVKLVEFQGNIYPYYENADLFALTSEWEGFGNVLVEALSVGLPVVSTNCPGGPKMILKNGKYGMLIPLGDKQAYVDALLKSLESPAKSQDSIEYAKRFTVESVAKDYLEVMQ